MPSFIKAETLSLALQENARLNVTENLTLRKVHYASTHDLPITTKHLSVLGDAPLSVEAKGDVTASSGSIISLALTGSGTQTVSGTLQTDTLRLRGSRADMSGTVYVADTLYGPSSVISGGKNIIFSGQTVENGRWNGDLTAQNASFEQVQISGSLFDNGGTSYAGNIAVYGSLDCTGASSMEDTAAVSVYETAWFQTPLAGAGKLILYGDLGMTSGVTLPQEVTLCGFTPQVVSGSFTVDAIHFANTGQKGITVQDAVTVTSLLDNPTGAVETKTPIYLGENGQIAENFSGSVSVQNWTLHDASVISGDLYLRDSGTVTGAPLDVKGTLNVEKAGTLDGCAVTAGALRSPSSLTLANGASVTVLGAAELGGKLTNPTEKVVEKDLNLTGLTASGAIRTKGDVFVSGTTRLGALTLDGSFKQEISGSALTVGDLNIYNTSGRPLKLGNTVTVTGRYD